ncbi:MAG: DUF1638 domain-containing protein [Desulfotomaculales bacterium]
MHCIVCCGILRRELEVLFREVCGNNQSAPDVVYLEAALHVDFKKIHAALQKALTDLSPKYRQLTLVYGQLCHPEMEELARQFGARAIPARNCIEMLLGEEMAKTDQEARTFYLTPGWLDNWQKIFIEGLGWDSVEARQNFGFYDRILLLDTGVTPLAEETILEFFEYAQVTIEIRPVGLQNLHKLILNPLQGE